MVSTGTTIISLIGVRLVLDFHHQVPSVYIVKTPDLIPEPTHLTQIVKNGSVGL
jgi:hypothetical protein